MQANLPNPFIGQHPLIQKIHGLVRKVAATLDVNVGQVYLARHRVGRLLKREVKKLENKQ